MDERVEPAEALEDRDEGRAARILAGDVGALVRPDQFPLNQELLQLSVAGEQYWDEAWSKFKAG